MNDEADIKKLTARSLKWNVIDRVMTQVLYAVTGIVLARELSQDDFGLVGVILIFQAFASLFVDSGFYSALIQRKNPSQLDYSTVLWFNIAMAVAIYCVLFFCAPLIAGWFQNDERLIALSRVMFLSFIINATAIVQINRLMKQMNVAPVAVTNAAGLFAGAVVGIWLAVTGYGAWAIVWQTIVSSLVKCLALWLTNGWFPSMKFSWRSLKSFMSVGTGVMFSSFLNTVFQNIYSFFIGNRVGLFSLGYYTQADKWSKMGITSISQAFSSSFLPTLSAVQDDSERFARAVTKMNRFSSYVMFPAIGFLIMLAAPIFNALFGSKWDAAIVLFQILLIRGFFTVAVGLYTNYLLALGRSRLIVVMEIVRDVVALAALFASFPFMALSTEDDPVYGIRIMLYGQLAASMATWIVGVWLTAPLTGHRRVDYLLQPLPYLAITTAIVVLTWQLGRFMENPWIICCIEGAVALSSYLLVNYCLNSVVQREVLDFIFNRKSNKSESKIV